jgi:cardiolipin synthase
VPFDLTVLGPVLALVHLAGVAAAFDAVMTGRTPQGSLAWALALATLPYAALPMYMVFGRRRYRGYLDARREGYGAIKDLAQELRQVAGEFITELAPHQEEYQVLEHLVSMPFTRGNDAELLIDGEATFAAIFAALEAAERYVLVQFFIVREDHIGSAFVQRLLACRQRGVQVCFLYDEVGSRELKRSYRRTLRAAGARIHPFKTTRGPDNRFQVNFRNHRKIVVVDGKVAFLGGINIGDEYLGHGEMGEWRDTFVRLTGPVVHGVQLSFLEDWHWATDEVPDWDWTPRAAPGEDRVALILPTGPADPLETASLVFVTLFHAARERLWITTPYFVFDSQVLGALELAALRGVDIRIIVPERADYRVVWLAGWTYYDDLTRVGVRLYQYEGAFMHQKLVLVDHEAVLIGTKNLDNRSQRLNFEISALFLDAELAKEAEEVFLRDLDHCTEIPEGALEDKPLFFRFQARATRLFAPVL